MQATHFQSNGNSIRIEYWTIERHCNMMKRFSVIQWVWVEKTSIRSSIYNKLQCLRSGCHNESWINGYCSDCWCTTAGCYENQMPNVRAKVEKKKNNRNCNWIQSWMQLKVNERKSHLCAMSFFTWPKCEFKLVIK